MKNPILNIIVRTHRRPAYFKKCIESIFNQNYDNIKIIVVVDDNETEAYVKPYKDDGTIDAIMRVNKSDFKSSDFSILQKAGVCTKLKDKDKHFYDLYINHVTSEIEDGFIWVVDDDNEIADSSTVDKIMKRLKSEEEVLFINYQMPTKKVPSDNNWKKLPFTRGDVDMSCFIWHASKSSFAQFDGHGAGDHRVANNLAKNLKPVWYKIIACLADNVGNRGKSEKEIR